MEEPPTVDEPGVEPVYLPDEREEKRCLDFHLAEIGRLHDRGLIAGEAFVTIASEARIRSDNLERKAISHAAFERATRLRYKDERSALALARRSIQVDPTRRAAWSLALDLSRRLRDEDLALLLCENANAPFSGFEISVDQLREEFEERKVKIDPNAFPLEEIREALRRGDDARVIAACAARLGVEPNHFDASVLLAFALQRKGDLEPALERYRRLEVFQPENATWGEWVRALENRLAARPVRPSGGFRSE